LHSKTGEVPLMLFCVDQIVQVVRIVFDVI
jgi:hypothetical protein